MKKVFIVRHAKSSWDDMHLVDYDRPLKGRGVKDAYLVSNWLSQNHERPDALYSSPATRALHTAMIFSRNLQFPFSKLKTPNLTPLYAGRGSLSGVGGCGIAICFR